MHSLPSLDNYIVLIRRWEFLLFLPDRSTYLMFTIIPQKLGIFDIFVVVVFNPFCNETNLYLLFLYRFLFIRM